MNEDPIGHSGGVNLYRYAVNDPVNRIDPSGLNPFTTFLRIGTQRGKAVYSEVAGRIFGPGRAAKIGQEVAEKLVENPSRFKPNQAGKKFLDAFEQADTVVTPNPLNSANAFAGPLFRILGAAEEISLAISAVSLVASPNPASAFFAGFDLGSVIVKHNPVVGTFWGDLFCDWLDCDGSDELAASGTTIVASMDPNDITGPSGVGAERFIRPELPLPYTTRFENIANATAPAAEVRITQQLDDDLDWSTFELGDVGFGNIVVNVPDGHSFYSTRVDATDTLGVLVDVVGGINQATGELVWTFTALDPLTLDLPIDPLIGFLPPNQSAPEGEGFVSYTIGLRPDRFTGTRIDAEARIFFDYNDPIDTPLWTNTIDAGAPDSSVEPLPAETNTESFTVSWSGTDDSGGSGIAHYDVYVAIDGGDFGPLRHDTTDTSLVFEGEFGRTYRFYSLATDNVGFTQAIPATAQAATTLTPPDGDFNDDGVYDCTDIDALSSQIASGANDLLFDITVDGLVNLADRDAWLAEAGAENLGAGLVYLLGDANLDGVVDVSDFTIWNAHKFTSDSAWCHGDFSADGAVDVVDFTIWNNHKFQSSDQAAAVFFDGTRSPDRLRRGTRSREVSLETSMIDSSAARGTTARRSFSPNYVDASFAISRVRDESTVQGSLEEDLWANLAVDQLFSALSS